MEEHKKFYLKYILVSFISFFTIFTMIGSTHSVKADQDWANQFITHAELQDKNGNPQISFGIYDNMKAHWDFNIPAGTDIKVGDTMTVDIPTILTLSANVSFDIKDTAGSVIGHAVADHTTRKVTIIFTDYASHVATNGIEGTFNLYVLWNHSKVEQNTTVFIDWGKAGSTEVIINPDNGPNSNEFLFKWGWYDKYDPSIIHWRVRINYAKEKINNTKYVDKIGDNQELVSGSVVASKVNYSDDGNSFEVSSVYPTTATIENGLSGFNTALGNIDTCVVIDYKTKITDERASSKYENSGELTGDNIEIHTIDAYSPDNGGSGEGKTKVSISGKKTWVDDNNTVGLRPNSITIDLFQNDQKINSIAVTESDNWAYNFTDLPKYDGNNQEYKYTLKEESVDNYISTQDGNNFINTITGETQIKGQKTWIDNDNSAKKRPESIRINLLADGKKVASKTVTEENGWGYDFGSLPKYQNGKVISYSIAEDFVKGYSTNVSGYNITNTYNEFEPVTPVQPKAISSDTNRVQPVNSKESDKTGNLPQTDDNSSMSILVMILGILILVSAIYLTIFKIKEKKVNH